MQKRLLREIATPGQWTAGAPGRLGHNVFLCTCLMGDVDRGVLFFRLVVTLRLNDVRLERCMGGDVSVF